MVNRAIKKCRTKLVNMINKPVKRAIKKCRTKE